MSREINRHTLRYIIITVCAILTVYLINGFIPGQRPVKDNAVVEVKELLPKLVDNPLFAAAVFLYLALLITGTIGILFILTAGARKRNNLFTLRDTSDFPQGRENNWQVLLAVLCSALCVNLASFITMYFTKRIPSPSYSVIYNFIIEIVTIIVLLRYLTPKTLGMKISNVKIMDTVTLYAVTAFTLIPAAVINQIILEKINAGSSANPAITIFLGLKEKPFVYLLISLIILAGPIAEEMFFRGFLFRWLRKKRSFPVSALIISLIFAAAHQTPGDFLPLFILSFSLCFIYERTHNLWSPVIMHSLHNSLGAMVLLAIHQSGLVTG